MEKFEKWWRRSERILYRRALYHQFHAYYQEDQDRFDDQ